MPPFYKDLMHDRIKADFERKLLYSMQPTKSVLTKKVVVEETINEDAPVNSIVSIKQLTSAIEQYQDSCKKFVAKCLKGNGKIVGVTRLDAHDNKEYVYGVTVLVTWNNDEDFDMTIWSDNTVSFFFGSSKRAILQRPTDQQCYDTIMEYMA